MAPVAENADGSDVEKLATLTTLTELTKVVKESPVAQVLANIDKAIGTKADIAFASIFDDDEVKKAFEETGVDVLTVKEAEKGENGGSSC